MTKLRIHACLILLLFGLVRLQFEHQLTQDRKKAFFHTFEVRLDVRQQLSQSSFLAALSGFRAVVADILWIEANSAWQRVEWGRMKVLFDTVTTLQPRALLFWDESAWHMAYNASVAAREDRKQPREALRIKAQREYFKIGEDYLLRGIACNPDRWQLYVSLGFLYQNKFNDPLKASEAFAQGALVPNAPDYVKRFAAFQLSYVPGREREAYELLKGYYNIGTKEHLPTLINRLHDLEEKLKVPPEQRIPSTPRPPQP